MFDQLNSSADHIRLSQPGPGSLICVLSLLCPLGFGLSKRTLIATRLAVGWHLAVAIEMSGSHVSPHPEA